MSRQLNFLNKKELKFRSIVQIVQCTYAAEYARQKF